MQQRSFRLPAKAMCLAAALAVAGCATHLSTRPDLVETTPDQALEGIPYSLPMVQFDIALTRSISSCPEDFSLSTGAGDQAPITITRGRLAFGIKAEVKERYVPGERYVIDYEPMKAPFSTASLAIALHPSGTLKSINASADDQTGAVIQAGVKLGLSVASLQPLGLGPIGASGFVGDAAPGRAEAIHALKALARSEEHITCTEEASGWLAAASATAKEQETATTELNAATADVARTSAVAALRNSQTSHLDALNTALANQAELTRSLAVLGETKQKLDGKLSASTPSVWPREFGDTTETLQTPPDVRKKLVGLLRRRTVHVLRADDVARWFQALPPALAKSLRDDPQWKRFLAAYLKADGTALEEKPGEPQCSGASSSVSSCIDASRLEAHASLRPAQSEPPLCSATSESPPAVRGCRTGPVAVRERDQAGDTGPVGRRARDGQADAGVFFRSQAQGVLEICRGEPSVDCEGDSQVIETKPVSAPQLGQLRFLPVRNEAFEASELSLVLRDDGSIDSFGYKKTRAALPGLLGAGAEAVGQYQGFRTARDAQAVAQLKSSRDGALADLQFQIDTLTRQKQLLALQTPSAPDLQEGIRAQTIQIDAEIALLRAQLGRIQAEAALAAATGGPAG